MLKIMMCDEGELVPDSQAREYAAKKIEQYKMFQSDVTVKVGTEMMLSAFVLPVIQHEFDSSDIKFYYEGVEYFYDDSLGLNELADPDKHIGYFADISEEILYTGIQNMRKEREKSVDPTA